MTLLAMDLNPINDVASGALGGAAEAAGEAVLDVVMRFVFGLIANAVAAITESILTVMNATTSVDLDGGFFLALTPLRRTVLGMSVSLILALFFLSVVRSLAAGEPGAIIRAALVDVPAAIFTTALSVTVAWVLIRVVDQASLAVTGDVAAAMGRLSAALSTVDVLTSSGLLGVMFGLLFIVGAILVWLQLLVRSALLYVLIVLAPLGFATRVHPSTRQIARRTIEMGVALILSKFAVAVSFGVGAAAIDSSHQLPASGQVDLNGMMTGVAVMLMAAFMPWVIWKAVPVVEAAAVAAGVERSPGRAATTAASLGMAVGLGVSRLAGSSGSASAGIGGASGGPGEGAGGGTAAGSGSPPAGGPTGGPPNTGGRAASASSNGAPRSSGGGATVTVVETRPAPAVVTVPVETTPASGSDRPAKRGSR